MMINTTLEEIKSIRKRLGLKQSELARMAGVSQSLIAKIESKRIDPSYSKAEKILKALEEASKNKKKKASEIMQRKIIKCSPDDDIRSVIKKMRKEGISQLPVFSEKRCVGRISESTIINALIRGDPPETIKELMEEAPPIISPDASEEVYLTLLKYYSLILVSEKGKIIGLITKSDVINNLEEIFKKRK